MDQGNQVQGVQFQEDRWSQSSPSFTEDDTPKMVKLVVKYSGGALSIKQAEFSLFVFAVVIFVLSLFLFFSGGHKTQKPSEEILRQIQQMPINQ